VNTTDSITFITCAIVGLPETSIPIGGTIYFPAKPPCFELKNVTVNFSNVLHYLQTILY
jgi:hypothetical protein